jgi:hypothetical protein
MSTQRNASAITLASWLRLSEAQRRLRALMHERLCDRISVTPVRSIYLPSTGVQLLESNESIARCFRIPKIKGYMSKDNEFSWIPITLCQFVKDAGYPGGFITTDELPRYGLSLMDKQRLYTAAGPVEADLDVTFACFTSRSDAEDIRSLIVRAFELLGTDKVT